MSPSKSLNSCICLMICNCNRIVIDVTIASFDISNYPTSESWLICKLSHIQIFITHKFSEYIGSYIIVYCHIANVFDYQFQNRNICFWFESRQTPLSLSLSLSFASSPHRTLMDRWRHFQWQYVIHGCMRACVGYMSIYMFVLFAWIPKLSMHTLETLQIHVKFTNCEKMIKSAIECLRYAFWCGGVLRLDALLDLQMVVCCRLFVWSAPE